MRQIHLLSRDIDLSTQNIMKNLIIALIFSLSLSACIRPYVPDIQQGNILNNSSLQELRYGMSKQEVLYILGTPMVIDPFNTQRWDYYYSNRDNDKRVTTTRLVTAIFDGDNLVALTGDVSLDQVTSLEPSVEDQQHGGTVVTKPTQREKGWLNRLGLFNRD